jgi:hypothetical protein
MSWEYDNRGSTMFEVGCALKPRFPIADGAAAIKPGLNIGYRAFSSKSVQSDKVNALAINMSIEIQFQTKSTVVPFFEFGFLAEPVGGNDLTKITFPPIIYFGGGVAF